MKLLTILTLVCLMMIGCGKGGSDSGDGSATAQSVSGSYSVKATRPNGDIVLIFVKLSAGLYESSDYKFTGGDMSKASYVKWTSSDVVSGNVHNTTITYSTCPTLNGITPPTTQSFSITPLAHNQILMHSNGLDGDVLMDKIDSIEQTLADAGTYLATEVTDCSATY